MFRKWSGSKGGTSEKGAERFFKSKSEAGFTSPPPQMSRCLLLLRGRLPCIFYNKRIGGDRQLRSRHLNGCKALIG
jgi:hypothetical protein